MNTNGHKGGEEEGNHELLGFELAHSPRELAAALAASPSISLIQSGR